MFLAQYGYLWVPVQHDEEERVYEVELPAKHTEREDD